MTDRNQYDGKPYYCDTCGLGFGEYLACGDAGCRLEPSARAASRQIVFLQTRQANDNEDWIKVEKF